jgi:transcriptional regulator with XRE-family HTH domain
MTLKAKESRKDDSARSFVEKPESTDLISDQTLWSRLQRGLKTRTRFVDSHLAKNLAFQIRGMREIRRWSQQDLAQKTGMTQNAISRLENPFYGKATITTLKRIAAACDVALVVRFAPFSQLVKWATGATFEDHGLSMESTMVPSFVQEDAVSGSTLGTVVIADRQHYSINVAAQTVSYSFDNQILRDFKTPSQSSPLGPMPRQAA